MPTRHLSPLVGSPRRRVLAAATLLLVAAAGAVAIIDPHRAHPHAAALSASVTGPACAPTVLNRSALLANTPLQVSPLPDSQDASPASQVSLLGVPAADLRSVTATGSRSGRHPGALRAYAQGDGASFVPAQPFTPGEAVSVRGVVQAVTPLPFAYTFTVSAPDVLARVPPGRRPAARPGDVQSYVSRRDLRPPGITVTARSPQAAPGDLFTAPYSGASQDGPLIFDNSGQVVWFDALPRGTEATDLQVQHYGGRPVLTWWQGRIPPQGFGRGTEMIADQSYRVIAQVRAGNGYDVDLHDFQITPQNTALFTVYSPIHCNLAALGGPRDGAVTDGIVQEVDLSTGLVRREWHSLDHVSLHASYQPAWSATLQFPFDYFHVNSVASGSAGQLLVSSRSTWSVFVVDGRTLQVGTQVGGRNSSLAMAAGAAPAWQHDARVLPDGDLSVFDNGAVPAVHAQSRGTVLHIDARSRTVTLVGQFVHRGPLLAGSQGNFQTLPNGDAFLGWGSQPFLSEYSPHGRLLFDAHFPGSTQSYRGFRFAWSATPTGPPALARRRVHGHLVLYVSWNGATAVAAWRVLTGPRPSSLAPLLSTRRHGFETVIRVSRPAGYIKVQALNAAGRVLRSSLLSKS